ncbi:MAG: DUF2339 domain-containing protein [Planctomycetota bacterium]|nr:DUF2339 domain-containing protein [Planctomycetota bacterium]
METLTLIAFLIALVAVLLAFLALQRLAELRGLEEEVQRLGREGSHLRKRVAELTAAGGTEAAAGAGGAGVEPDASDAPIPAVPATKKSAEELLRALADAQPDADAEEVPTPPTAPAEADVIAVRGIGDPDDPEEPAALGTDRGTPLSAAAHREAARSGGVERPSVEPHVAARPKRSGLDLERMLGVRGAAVLGGLVMALAAILFFKHAFQQGWISPKARLLSGAVWGVLLLVAGNVAKRRAFRWVPDALQGAGLVAFYATIWATNYHYGYIGPTLAFGLMGLVTALGCVLALRGDSLVTAQVGLVGGFATPLLLSSTSVQPFGLFGYLLLLDVALLFLGRRRGWPSVGLMAIVGTALFEFLWFVTPGVLGRDSLGWSGGVHEGFGVALLLAFGLAFLVVGATATQGDEPDEPGRRKRGRWQLVELGGLGTSGAFAMYLAVEGELSAALWPTALMAVVLAAGALFLALRRGQPALAMAAPLFGLAISAAWALDRELTLVGEAWQLVPSVLALGALGCVPLFVRDIETRTRFLPGARSSVVVAAGILMLLAGSGPDQVHMDEASHFWPLYLGLVGVGSLLVALHARSPEAPRVEAEAGTHQPHLAFGAGLLLALGLFLRLTRNGFHDVAHGIGPWTLALAVALPLLLAHPLRRRRLAPGLFSGLGLPGLLLLGSYYLLSTDAAWLLPAEQPDLLAFAARGILPALLLAGVVYLAAALAGVASSLQPPASGRFRFTGHALVALVAPLFVLQAIFWLDWISKWEWQAGVSIDAGTAAGTFAATFFGGLLVLLWPTLHARLVPVLAGAEQLRGQPTAAPSWSWRMLGMSGFAWAMVLHKPFSEATDLAFEREGMLLVAFALGILLLVALRFGGGLTADEVGGRLRTAVNWLGAVVVALVAIVVGELLPDWEALTSFGLFALGVGGLARLTGRASALRFGQVVAALAGLSLMLMAIQGGDFRFSDWPVWNWHAYTLLGLAAVVATLLVVGRPLRRDPVPFARGLDVLSAGLVLALVFLWLNLEISNHFDGIEAAAGRGRVSRPGLEFGHLPPRDLAMSVAWGLFAILLLVVGSRRSVGALRWTSLGLILAAITKVFVFDLSHLEGLFRVGSLVGLALSLIVVSLLYQRFVFARASQSDEAGPGAG